MSNSKFLSDGGWKDVASKNKIKDNGLLKILMEHKRLDQDKHDDVLASLEQIIKLSSSLKKSKEVASASGAAKYIADLSDAAETDRRAVLKAKAEADKKGKTDADAAKREAAAQKGKDDDDDDEDDESPALLTSKMLPLVRLVNKGVSMHALVASTGKQAVVMLSRKPIATVRRKLLAAELGNVSGIKYSVGHCIKEDGVATFVMKTQVAGMAKRLKVAVLQQTGVRMPKLRCRGEDGETDDDMDDPVLAKGEASEDGDDEGEAAEAGNGRDAKPAVSARLAPDTESKARATELADAPEVWESTRRMLQTNIDALKQAVRSQVADEGGELVSDIDGHLKKLDRILGSLDRRLANSLAVAGEAQDAVGRSKLLVDAKGILAEYIRYVKSEPLIDHIDSNPFGVKTELKATLSRSLTQLARAIG